MIKDLYPRVADLSAAKRALLMLKLGKRGRGSAPNKHSSTTKRLVAYIVPDNDGPRQTASALREFLSDKLPEYMIPAAYVYLDSIPLTATGKVDRRTLPLPEESSLESAEQVVAPRDSVEEVIAAIWADVLEREPISVAANFFELGGHSLAAAQVIYRVRDIFQIELPMRSLFEAPTVAELSQVLIAGERSPGQIQKVANAFKRLRSLSSKEMKQLLEKKRRLSSKADGVDTIQRSSEEREQDICGPN